MKFLESLAALLLITLVLLGCNKPVAEKNNEIVEQSAAFSKLIKLNVTVIDVFFEESEYGEPSVTDNTNKSQIEVVVEKFDGKFYITSNVLQTSVSEPGYIIVHVPKGYEINANGVTSNFRINSSCSENITVKSMSGNIRSNCIASSYTLFESMSGDVIVKCSLKSGMHLFSSLSGDIDVLLRNGSIGKVAAVSEKGSVMINQEMKHSGKIIREIRNPEVTLVSKTISGDVVIEL